MLSHECRVPEATAAIPPPPHDAGEGRNTTLLFICFLKLPSAGFFASFSTPSNVPKDDCLTLLTTDQFGFPMILRATSRTGMEQNEEQKHWGLASPLSCSCVVELKHFLQGIVSRTAVLDSPTYKTHKVANCGWEGETLRGAACRLRWGLMSACPCWGNL